MGYPGGKSVPCWFVCARIRGQLGPMLTLHNCDKEEAESALSHILTAMPQLTRNPLVLVKITTGACWCEVNDAKALEAMDCWEVDAAAIVKRLIDSHEGGKATVFAEPVTLRTKANPEGA